MAYFTEHAFRVHPLTCITFKLKKFFYSQLVCPLFYKLQLFLFDIHVLAKPPENSFCRCRHWDCGSLHRLARCMVFISADRQDLVLDSHIGVLILYLNHMVSLSMPEVNVNQHFIFFILMKPLACGGTVPLCDIVSGM